ncbi:cornifelin homolog [Exaiptasia diaphana]|uniref:Uncharacterized protein n=1 Tax=Exaiptasia diaphana TaxID=2652724 RepID=A0A913X643_EXADI|nr:cornifelin homolog [Exaiptasia diaphana]KXJ15085.1 Placenta-specific gene 8 protein [Exaiptasia diaphana]
MAAQPVAGYERMQEDPTMDKPPIMNQPGYGPPGYPDQGYPQQGYPPQYPAGQTTTTTNVVVVQQPTFPQQRNWNSGMCACFDDCGSCCLGLMCPCFLLIDVSQRMGEGCCFPCCCPGALLGLRIKLRTEQNIQGSLMDDYCVTQCCATCVLCQLARELKFLGR